MAGNLELPSAITELQASFPWSGIAARARHHLASIVPELAPEIEALRTKVFGLESGFFYFPAAQAMAWANHDSEWIEELFLVLAIGHAHFAIQDTIVDTGGCAPGLALISDVCLLAYLDLLDQLSPITATQHRALHDRYYRWYLRGLLTELKHRRELTAYSLGELSELGLKAAPGNTVINVIAEASGRPESAESTVLGVMQLCTGLQLLDDLNDLERDYRDVNYTPPLTLTLLTVDQPARAAVESADLVPLSAASGVAHACIQISELYFGLAGTSAMTAGADVLGELAEVWTQRAEKRRRSIDEALQLA